ncbi:MAG: class I SAM-dependent methyltransferase [Planctomycetota bacterium]|jgi:SAM-dependent methyltransferase
MHLIPRAGSVLDLACGSGRNSRLLLAAGFEVTAVDLDPGDPAAWPQDPRLNLLQADLEAESWPLGDRCFDAVLVCNYLWRPRFPEILAAVAAGGLLIYETFAQGQEALGRPRRPDFLLQPGELLERLPADWRVIAFDQGLIRDGKDAIRQRVVARRPPFTGPDSIQPIEAGP